MKIKAFKFIAILLSVFSAFVFVAQAEPVKQASVDGVETNQVIVCGSPFGVMLYSKGVMVVGSNSFKGEKGEVNPSKAAGIKQGDLLITLNGEYVTSNEDVARIIEKSNGNSVQAVCERDSREYSTLLHPQKCVTDGAYKVGLWVRDSSAGIGTMTFYDVKTGISVGFGHGICDSDTKQIVPISSGRAVSANLYGIRKGAVGNPGELLGTLNVFGNIGSVQMNDETGVYIDAAKEPKGIKMPVSASDEISAGKAEIYLSVDGNAPQYYAVKIDKIKQGKTKNFTVTVIDEKLIKATGGIVQGMSGSPILKDGKLIGAITHVLVDDSTRGYGIFAENMLETARSLEKLKEAG